jgi:hypothetical protein
VNTTSCARAPNPAASDSLAVSKIRLAARPAWCTEAGFPTAAIADMAASRAAGRNGSLAFASK